MNSAIHTILRVLATVLLAQGTTVSLPSLCFGQEESLWLAGVTMRIGMPKEEVVGQIRHHGFKLQETEYTWLVLAARGNPPNILGSVNFENGKLSAVNKTWGNFGGSDALALGNALFSVLSERGTLGECNYWLTTRRRPGVVFHDIKLLFARPGKPFSRSITISVMESRKHGDSVSIEESLGF